MRQLNDFSIVNEISSWHEGYERFFIRHWVCHVNCNFEVGLPQFSERWKSYDYTILSNNCSSDSNIFRKWRRRLIKF